MVDWYWANIFAEDLVEDKEMGFLVQLFLDDNILAYVNFLLCLLVP
jgi:hypothetical protein